MRVRGYPEVIGEPNLTASRSNFLLASPLNLTLQFFFTFLGLAAAHMLAPLLPTLVSLALAQHAAYVALTVPDPAPLEARLKSVSHPLSPDYGRWLTATEVATLAHPPRSQQERVVTWLRRFNVTRLQRLGDTRSLW